MNPEERSVLHKVLWVLIALILLALVFAAAYLIANNLLDVFWPSSPLPPLVRFLLTVLLGFILFALLALAGTCVGRWHRSKEGGRGRVGMDTLLLDAMDRIAHGDFDVSITPVGYGVYTEVIDAINRMAQQLGTMEGLRQDFISNVSHEIQSPLTSISGFAKLLQDQDASLTPQQRTHYLGIIEAESKRLSKLSDNLMKLSSLESQSTPLNRREYRLDQQLQSVILMLEPQWQAKQLEVEAELAPATCNGDEELLAQVWVNLLGNAIKFTPAGGSLRVTLHAQKDGHNLVRITDNGIGIAPEAQMHIFERFYKVDKARERAAGGNGLGLSLTKKILELHGARIDVHSALKEGSTFTVGL
ncbi:MAG: HAMP domain-containing histidine kinase [Coriobacteriales bacterium]|jgi:signal transduction histidine kinase|nr:HAMP domain-containing histidine kinase [Coriobacteriales bacterium]